MANPIPRVVDVSHYQRNPTPRVGVVNDNRGAVPLTHERVLELLSYEPSTSLLRWMAGQRKGMVAGFDNGIHLRIGIDGTVYYAHRVIWFYVTGRWPTHCIDHRDRDGHNNRWPNLREADFSQNHANRKNETNKTLPKGVELHVSGKYRARVTKNKKTVHLGLFETPEEAHGAYIAHAKKLFGEFARAA